MSFGINFGHLIALKRGVEGLTQQELAVLAFAEESKKTRISELENGKVAKPHRKTIDALCVALNISALELRQCHSKIEDPFRFLKDRSSEFIEQNPDSSPIQINSYLAKKSKQYDRLIKRFAELAETEANVSDEIEQAMKELQHNEFDLALDTLRRAESTQQSEITLGVVRDQSKIRLEMGNVEMIRESMEKAAEHFLFAASYISPFDKEEAAKLRQAKAIEIEKSASAIGKGRMEGTLVLLRKNIEELNPLNHQDTYYDCLLSLGANLFNKAAFTEDNEHEAYSEAARCFDECLSGWSGLDVEKRQLIQNNLSTSLLGIYNDCQDESALNRASSIAQIVLEEIKESKSLPEKYLVWAHALNTLLNCAYSAPTEFDIISEKTLNESIFEFDEVGSIFPRTNNDFLWAGKVSYSIGNYLRKSIISDDKETVVEALCRYQVAYNCFKWIGNTVESHRASRSILELSKSQNIDIKNFELLSKFQNQAEAFHSTYVINMFRFALPSEMDQ